MAKSKKSQNVYVIPVDTVKLAFLAFLTVVLCVSGYMLFTKDRGAPNIAEPTRIEGSN